MSMRGEVEYDEPCDDKESTGETERAEDTDECRECDPTRPREGGRSEPSSAVMEFRKSDLRMINQDLLLSSLRCSSARNPPS